MVRWLTIHWRNGPTILLFLIKKLFFNPSRGLDYWAASGCYSEFSSVLVHCLGPAYSSSSAVKVVFKAWTFFADSAISRRRCGVVPPHRLLFLFVEHSLQSCCDMRTVCWPRKLWRGRFTCWSPLAFRDVTILDCSPNVICDDLWFSSPPTAKSLVAADTLWRKACPKNI